MIDPSNAISSGRLEALGRAPIFANGMLDFPRAGAFVGLLIGFVLAAVSVSR